MPANINTWAGWRADCRDSAFAFCIAASLLIAAALFNPPPPLLENGDLNGDSEFFSWEDLSPQDGLSPQDAPLPDNYATVEKYSSAPPAAAPVWLPYKIQRNDTMDRVLKKIGVGPDARSFLQTQKFKTYRRLRRGSALEFQHDESGRVNALRYKTSPEYYFHAGLGKDGKWWANEAPPVLMTVRQTSGGKIESSLFAAADRAGLSDGAINLLIEALETQVDFHRDTRPGDTFRALYTEVQDEDGKPVGTGQMLSFEYVSMRSPKSPRKILGARHEGGYYSPKGESLRGAFLRAPLKFRRISSRFTNRRFHPVLKKWRAHRGVDYAAPSGTPVRATADGTIKLVARQRGYGNIITIQHLGIYTTVYAHLRGFAKGMRRGRKVRQGQTIGYVGQTGLATGPHLHYEFRVRGKHKNPLSESVPRVLPPLSGDKLKKFTNASAPLFAELDRIVIL